MNNRLAENRSKCDCGYRRTPLPESARPKVAWIAVCLGGIVFGPFLAFVMVGKVTDAGLQYALSFVALSLAGLVFLTIQYGLAWRKLPPDIVKEWKSGRVVMPDDSPQVLSPVRFCQGRDWLTIELEGVTISRHSVLRMQWITQFAEKCWSVEQTGQLHVPWSDILEWIVNDDSDGPDYYLLKLKSGGGISVRRFQPDSATECTILDAVRSIGKIAVRLRCDVSCTPVIASVRGPL